MDHVVEIDPGTLHPATRPGMVAVAKNSSIQLRSEHLDQAFSFQIVKNLVYVGKAFYGQGVNGTAADEHHKDSAESSSEGEADREQETKEERILQAPLPWLFSKLSYQAKTAHLKRRNSFVAPVSNVAPLIPPLY
jgi:U3 small nucleolar RNA-associated protein 20